MHLFKNAETFNSRVENVERGHGLVPLLSWSKTETEILTEYLQFKFLAQLL
jgi:hypothetical protein